ncbi:hypothetical protein ScPMuIL_005377 [Solemya velum]
MAASMKHVLRTTIFYSKERVLQRVTTCYSQLSLRLCHVEANSLSDSDDTSGHQGLQDTRDRRAQKSVNIERAVGRDIGEQYQRILLQPDQPLNAKILRLAIIGAPNCGKSMLTNQLMGWKVTSVSNKVHTTRRNTLAVWTEDKNQIVFMDTPGIVHPKQRAKHNLEKSLMRDPENSLETADLVAVVVDTSNKWTRNVLSREILRALYLNPHVPSILILNKVDELKTKEVLLQMTRSLTENIVDGTHINAKSRMFSHRVERTNLEALFDKYEARTEMLYGNRFGLNSPSKGLKTKSLEAITSDIDRTVLNGLPYDKDYPDENIENDYSHHENDYFHNESEIDWTADVHGDTSRTVREEVIRKLSLKSGRSLEEESKHFGELENTSGEEISQNSGDTNTQSDKSREIQLKRIKCVNDLIRGKRGWPHFRRVFMVSAKTGDGLSELKDYLLECCHPGDWEYNSAMVTDQDPQELAMMYVREKILNYLPQEIPYQILPEIVIWEVDESGFLNVVMNINTYNKRHFSFTLGKRGETIQKISEEAKQDMMNTFRCEMRLKLQVRLKH